MEMMWFTCSVIRFAIVHLGGCFPSFFRHGNPAFTVEATTGSGRCMEGFLRLIIVFVGIAAGHLFKRVSENGRKLVP